MQQESPSTSSPSTKSSPPRATREFFTRVHVRWIVAWLVAANIALTILNSRAPMSPLAWPSLVFYAVIIAWIIAQQRKFRGLSWRPLAFYNGWLAALGAVLGLFFAIAINAVIVVGLILGATRAPVHVLPFREGSELQAVLACGLLVIVVPIIEELLFRGIILGRWQALFGPRGGYWLTAIAFAMLHGAFFPALLFALLLNYLYLSSGELWSAIGAHAVNNASAIAWERWGLPRALDFFRGTSMSGVLMTCTVALAVGLAGLIGFLALFRAGANRQSLATAPQGESPA